jgi:hypothetical protein
MGMNEEQYDNPTNLDDVMREIRQLRLAVQELTRKVDSMRPDPLARNDGMQLMRTYPPGHPYGPAKPKS